MLLNNYVTYQGKNIRIYHECEDGINIIHHFATIRYGTV